MTGLSDSPLPMGPLQSLPRTPAHCGGTDENSQSPHIYLAPSAPLGVISLLLGLGGTAFCLLMTLTGECVSTPSGGRS